MSVSAEQRFELDGRKNHFSLDSQLFSAQICGLLSMYYYEPTGHMHKKHIAVD